jgi:Hsp70 protein
MSIDQGGPKRHALGVDFGTSNTVAVARWPDGRARPILVDGSPLLPSAVYAEPDGQLIAGRDAVHSARLDPARFEPNPKRRVDDGLVLLGDREFPVAELIAAVLGRVAEEWRRTVGPVPTDVTLTCPATWGATRRTLLAEAAGRAGLAGARLVAEPVAAATYFAEVLGRDVPIGSVVVVHDFGAGTFDASVVARTAEGFEVMAVDGRDDIGGLDVDAAIVEHLGRTLAETDAEVWQRLTEPGTLEDRRAQRQLWDDVRIAKERLSRYQSADFVLPLLNREIHITRDELEDVGRPVLDQTVKVTRGLLRWADLPDGRLAGVFLVGGASRIPLVATLLHRELDEAPVVIEQPELVVAEGSILADAALLASGAAAPGPTAELRLVFDRRNESETVRVSGRSRHRPPEAAAGPAGAEPAADGSEPRAAAPVSVDDQDTVRTGPDGSEMPPAVDPWPDAVPFWESDPDQTVATGPTWRADPTPSRSSAPSSPAPGSAAGGSTARASADPRRAGQAPVSPARPMSPAQPPSRPVSPSRPPASRSAANRSQANRPQANRPQANRPQANGSHANRPQANGSQANRPHVHRPSAPPATTARWQPSPPAPSRPRTKRRPGGFARFIQVLISIVVLIAAPVAALVFAYSYGTGEPLRDSAVQLIDQLRELINGRIL